MPENFDWLSTSSPYQPAIKKPKNKTHSSGSPLLNSLCAWNADEGRRTQTMSDPQLSSCKASRSPAPSCGKAFGLSRLPGFRSAELLTALQLSGDVDKEQGNPSHETVSIQALRLPVQQGLWMTSCYFSPAKARFQWKWCHSEL